MESKQLTAITYARKSVKIRGVSKEDSISYQQVKMDDYARQHNYQVIKRYNDVGYTGINTDRPELIEMLDDLEQNKVDCLLVYSVDRLGRDLKNNIKTMLLIFDSVKQVVFVTGNFSSSSDYFKMFFLFLTAMAQEERENLLRKVSDGRMAKVLKELAYDGKYPLGYVKQKDTYKILPASIETTSDEEKHQEVIVLTYIFYCYLMKMSLRRIAALLNEKFGRTKRGVAWSYKSVQYILRNRHYSGFLTGTIDKKYHYFEETENVVSIIEPIFHEKIIKMLDNEKPGRKNNNIFSPPLFCICKGCGQLLVENKKFLECVNCSYSTEVSKLIKLLVNETALLLKSNFKKTVLAQSNELVKQYRMRINSLLRFKKQQEVNKEIIERNADHDPKAREFMLSINTSKICETSKEIKLYEMLKERLLKQVSIDCEPDESNLINLPFILIFDWSINTAHVVFHPKILGGVSNES